LELRKETFAQPKTGIFTPQRTQIKPLYISKNFVSLCKPNCHDTSPTYS
jgi:hypothetical protein